LASLTPKFSTNMKLNTTAVILSLLHLTACIFAGALGWEAQFIIVALAGAATTWITYRRIRPEAKNVILVLCPFYLIYIPASIYYESFSTFPIWLFGLLTCFTTFLLLRTSAKAWTLAGSLCLLFLAGHYLVLPNYLAWLYQEQELSRFNLANTRISYTDNNEFDVSELKGKVVLLDIWSSNCLPCIKKFPQLQALYEDFKNDTSVRIISLNIPLGRESKSKSLKQTEKYSFEKLYFADQKQADKLHISGVPLVLIFDKDLECRYAGDLNTGKNIFFGNASQIINQLKKEK
jgi:thiol-disulfide isomerase/thioredoxin